MSYYRKIYLLAAYVVSDNSSFMLLCLLADRNELVWNCFIFCAFFKTRGDANKMMDFQNKYFPASE